MLNPKHILITGASSGIGAALAQIYAAPGIRLSLHGRKESRLRNVAEAAEKRGAVVTAKAGDVVYAEGMAAWVSECDRIQPLDLVVANAGVSAGTGPGGSSDDKTRAIFAINLTGTLNTIQPLAPLMMQRGRGQIAIMSSMASFRGYPGAAAYCASKAALRIYGEALRGDLAPHGIEVNVICPGFIKTPLTDRNSFSMPFIMTADQAARIIRKGLAHNRTRIAFPWPVYVLTRLFAALPQDWAGKLAARLPKKDGKS